MDGVQIAATIFLIVFVALLFREYVTDKKKDELNTDRWLAQRRVESVDDVRTLEALWGESFDDPERQSEYEAKAREWYDRNPWALGLQLEEAAWVLRQGREHENPPRWRDEIEAKREADDDIALVFDSEDRTRIAEGRPTPREWEESLGWGERHRITPEEISALEQQYGALRTRDVMEILRRRFKAKDDAAWVEQVGPILRQDEVAELLGRTEGDVADDAQLVCFPQRGEVVFPAFQFSDDGTLVDGVADVVAILRPVVSTPRTIAGWLTSLDAVLSAGAPTRQLRESGVPINRLRAGDIEPVLQAARRVAGTIAP